ncbi:MAG: phospho-sugar mutase [Bacilli bacterium]|jgi:phosphoglucomutase|nr:phospho-sugar mutase [Bacilli bacterium]
MKSIVNENYERWVNSPKVSKEDKETIRKMSQKDKDDAFFQDIEFGTAGMRGVIGPGTNRMNEFTVKKATIAFGMFLLEKFPDAKTKGVAISHDNRYFSRQFTLESARLLNELGIKAYIFDSLRPTPELSYAVRYVKAAGGIMITASHNPKQYNGYKVYDENGCQLVPDKIKRLVEIIASLPDELTVEPTLAPTQGTTSQFDEKIDDDYVKEVEGVQINPDLPKKGFKIVYTPQHGTSYENAMRVFKDCGYGVIPVTKQCTHDPNFGGTLSPNPETAESFIEPIKLAEQVKANIIVMTDPDGDRCGVGYLSSKGKYERFTGNQSAALLMDYIFNARKEKGTLSKDGVMYDTIVTSDLGRKIAHSYGIKNESFLTGFKYIGDRIDHYEKLGKGPHFEFGYEESYGCLIQPFVRDKDGIQAILLYCEMALYYFLKKIPLDVAYRNLELKYGFHETITDSVYFEGSEGSAIMKKIMDELHANPPMEVAGLKVKEVQDYEKGTIVSSDGTTRPTGLEQAEVVKLIFDDTSWIAIRPSGTEPKCKFYVEAVAKDDVGLKERAQKMVSELKKDLGVRG